MKTRRWVVKIELAGGEIDYRVLDVSCTREIARDLATDMKQGDSGIVGTAVGLANVEIDYIKRVKKHPAATLPVRIKRKELVTT